MDHKKNNLLGQEKSLHFFTSLYSPKCLQSFPPYVGDGLLQNLILSCVPPPHDTEQRLNCDQGPKAPSTEKKDEIESVIHLLKMHF